MLDILLTAINYTNFREIGYTGDGDCFERCSVFKLRCVSVFDLLDLRLRIKLLNLTEKNKTEKFLKFSVNQTFYYYQVKW
jgi:hypothetical protein